MKVSGFWLLASALIGLLATAGPASADATVYAGAVTGGGSRSVVGGAIGFFPRETGAVIGFEIDHMRTIGGVTPSRPRIESSGGALLVQVYVVPRRFQAYGALGGGVFSQDGGDQTAAGIAANFGGGIKITLAGPLRIRLDYRLFVLSQNPDQSLEALSYKHPQRVTAGLALAF